MRSGTATLACLLMAAGLTAPAGATTYLITYTGTISAGTDHIGQFGAAGRDLAGLAFTSVYTLTIPTPAAVEYHGAASAYYAGGPESTGGPSPVTASFTLDGTTVNVGASYGYAYQEHAATNQWIEHITYDHAYLGTFGTSIYNQFAYLDNYVYASAGGIFTSTDFPQELSFNVDLLNSFGSGVYNDYIEIYDSATNLFMFQYNVQSTFKVSSVTVAQVAETPAVPEPATWAMLIAGFGLVGAALRRRPARARPASA